MGRRLLGSEALASDVVSAVEAAGYVRLSAAFDAEPMRALVWRALGTHGVREADTSTWTPGRTGKSVSRVVQEHRAFQAFWTPQVVSALDALLAGCWSRPTNAGETLLTFPDHSAPLQQLDPFHSDFAMDVPETPLFAVNVFACLDAVRPASGGTMIVRGSHKLVRRYLDGLPPGVPRRRAAAQFAADHPWLVKPTTDPLIGATFDDKDPDLKIEEFTGEPGDVIVTHPWTLHAGASNTGTRPRMMLRHRILRGETLR